MKFKMRNKPIPLHDPRVAAAGPEGYVLARRVIKYFGDEDIPEYLDSDIEVRDMARTVVRKVEQGQ